MVSRMLVGTALVAAVLLALLAAWQRPVRVPLNIGVDEGVNNDYPFLVNFNDPELRSDTGERYRWSRARSQIVLPAWPERAALLALTENNGAPAMIGLAGRQIAGLAPGRTLTLFVPPAPALHATITVAAPFPAAADDPRELGAALQGGRVTALAGWRWPPPGPWLAWTLPVLALWVMIWLLGGSQRLALALGALTGAGAAAAVWFAPLRVALAAQAVTLGVLYGTAAALLAFWVLPRLPWFVGVPRHYLRWLALVLAALFTLRVIGRMVPGTMPGDIGFHRNRVLAMLIGDVYRTSLHRGVPFPYPPLLYALLQPLTVLGLSIDWILQLSAAICDALCLPLIFILTRRMLGLDRPALLAALLYALLPAGFMMSAWSFDSHITTQFVTLLWVTCLVFWWRRWTEPRIWWLLLLLLAAAMLGHFGFYLNLSAMSGLLVLGGAWAWWRGHWSRREALGLLGLTLLAQVLVWALYYSAFWDLLLSQLRSVEQNGATGLNNRQALSRLDLLRDTVVVGFWAHFALLPVLLAPAGWYRLRRSLAARPAAFVLAANALVSLGLGALPIITGVPLTTRWLMFSAWVVAVGAALALDWLWRRRAAWGRWATAATLALVAVAGLIIWVETVAFRIRPPEPF